MLSSLPKGLTAPIEDEGHLTGRLLLDLTVYLVGPSEREFEYLLEQYETAVPLQGRSQFLISELSDWSSVHHPALTQLGRAAALAGTRRPFFEPPRQCIRDGRAFSARYWDGKPLGDPDGMSTFNCGSVHKRKSGLHGFVNWRLPLNRDPQVLRRAALEIADNVEFHSGHAGLGFTYDQWRMFSAFDEFYRRAMRFVCVDIEHLGSTLPVSRDGLKNIGWLTLLGRAFAERDDVATGLAKLSTDPEIVIERRTHGTVITIGPEPIAGDVNRPSRALQRYYDVGAALAPVMLTDHPDFPSSRFRNAANTVGYIHRFEDPTGWR